MLLQQLAAQLVDLSDRQPVGGDIGRGVSGYGADRRPRLEPSGSRSRKHVVLLHMRTSLYSRRTVPDSLSSRMTSATMKMCSFWASSAAPAAVMLLMSTDNRSLDRVEMPENS